MVLEKFNSQQEEKIKPRNKEKVDESVENIIKNQDIVNSFLEYSVMLQEKKLYYKYQDQEIDVFWWNANVWYDESAIKSQIWEIFCDKMAEFWILDSVLITYNVLFRYCESTGKNTDLIADFIQESFKLTRTKLNSKRIKENSDLFSLFLITNFVLWKKTTYTKIQKCYDSFFENAWQQEIVKQLNYQLEIEHKNVNDVQKKIEQKNSDLLIQTEEFSNLKDNFYNNFQIIENLNIEIENSKIEIEKLEKQKEEKILELEKYKNDLQKAKKIQEEINQIEKEILDKQNVLKLLESQKQQLDDFSFSWYYIEMTDEQIDIELKKQKIQYWLDAYGQKEFDAQTVLDALENAELAINTLWDCAKTSYNTKLKSKYDEELKKIQEKNPDYKVVIPIDVLMSFMFLESHFGTAGLGKKKNPWNVFNTWDRWYSFPSWQEWIEACAFNLATRILSYQGQFWIEKNPTVKELAENKSQDWLWFLIGIENRGIVNSYRTWKVVVNWETVDWTLNPKWAYMAWYPWWTYVLSCYKKIDKINQIYDASFQIYKKEQELLKEWISEDEKTIIQKEIDNLKNTKIDLESQLQELQKSELSLQPIQTDIDALWEEYANELSNIYSQQKQVEDAKVWLKENSENIKENTKNMSENISEILLYIENLNFLLKKIAIINYEIENYKISENSLLSLDDGELMISKQELEILQKNASDTFGNIQSKIEEIQSKYALNQEFIDELILKNPIKINSNEEMNVVYNVDDWYDLSILNTLAWWIWDSIMQTMHFIWNQKNYKWFKNTFFYPWEKSSYIKEKYFNLISPKLSSWSQEKPEYFVVFTWFNDLPKDDTWSNISLIVDDLISKWITPVVCSLYPILKWRNFYEKNEEIKNWCEIYKELWKELIYVDYRNFVSSQDDDFKKKFYSWDWIHPEKRWAKQLNAYLQEIIKNYN